MKLLRSPWLLRLAVVVAGVACMAPGCNGDVLSDSTFRLWCGDVLCDWRLDAGHVKRVPTWHPDDYGVELGDAPTQISQETGEGSDCMEFSAIADVAAESQTSVEVDFDLDGVADYHVPIAQTGWRPAKALIYGPLYAKRLRFIVRKDGPGRSVLAEIRLQRVTTCTGSRVQTTGLGVGAACDADQECGSGICCGVGSGKVCSACCKDQGRGCATGQTCAYADVPAAEANRTLLPQLCDPGLGRGKKGEPCVDAADCASHACTGVTYARPSDCPEAGALDCFPDRVRAGHCE